MPKAGHIFAKVRETNPNHHFSSLIVHSILRLPCTAHLLCTCVLNSICFCRFVSVNPGRMRLVYMQKSGCDLSQLKIVWDEHQSPVSFATLAYEREQFPPFSFCKACTTASLITLCFARWSRAFFSYGTLSAGETSSHFCW
jgi:hypothetical protein